MTDNQTQKETSKSTTKPPSPSLATAISIAGKRLLANSSPKHEAPSPQSSLSSDSFSDEFRKKTRELLNFSDCHSCGPRSNLSNPKDRLQTLDSVWRTILLCKKCIKRLQLAEICPYCFDNTLELECFKCGDCGKFIHKDCVGKYGESPPWSYCHLGSQFSICVDCWVPNLLANSSGRSRNKEVCDSRSFASDNGPKLLEDLVEDANFVVEKKLEIVAKAKEDALRKAVAAKNAVAFANGVLGLVAKNDENCGKSKCWDDEELALQLHRTLNRSPRIAKNFCSVNLSCLDVWNVGDLGIYGKTGVCANRQLNEKPDGTVWEHSLCDYARLKGNEYQENGEVGMAEVIIAECNSSVDARLHSGLKYYRRRNKLSQKLHSEVYKTQGNGNRTMLFYSRRNKKHDSYLLKYGRRLTSSKTVSNGETKFLYDGLRLRNQIWPSG